MADVNTLKIIAYKRIFKGFPKNITTVDGISIKKRVLSFAIFTEFPLQMYKHFIKTK